MGKGAAREKITEDSEVFLSLKALRARIQSDSPPDDEEVEDELKKLDLEGAGVKLGSGRKLPLTDIVEELSLIPRIPHQELMELEASWRKGKKESVDVFEKLAEWHQQGLVPSGWLQAGVQSDEQEIALRESSPLAAPPTSTGGPAATT